MPRILVVEDNENLAFGLRANLEVQGYDVDVAGDAAAGIAAARRRPPDLVVLDVMLPDMDGFRALRALRGNGLRAPVLMLTARGEERDKVRGLKLGADDYVTKPFGLLELMARIEALLRRAAPGPAGAERFGDVTVDLGARSVTRGKHSIELAPREFDLLAALLRRAGAVVTREELLRQVWGYDADVVSRTVDTHIAALRRKLETDPAHPRHLLTARKAGYRLER